MAQSLNSMLYRYGSASNCKKYISYYSKSISTHRLIVIVYYYYCIVIIGFIADLSSFDYHIYISIFCTYL